VSHYRTNLRDIEFNLFEVTRIQDHLGREPFVAFDEDMARDILREIERLAIEEFAASFEEADRTPLLLVDGVIELPAGLKRSLDAVFDGGWHRFGVDERLGGAGAPPSLRWAVHELLAGANSTAHLYVSSPLIASALLSHGTEEQIETWAVPLLEHGWGSTMVLTEADAGSDVGAGTTMALHVEGDVYYLEGVKRFVTSGESDYFDNIVHLVLARPEGAVPGTKGLSMFIVPKFLLNDDGTLGERNGVVATNLEKKMGIKGSTTCELTFGLDKPCVGYLVGGVHEGIRQMFKVIEEARMHFGQKALAILSTGYLNALEYARERVQGPDIAQAREPEAPRVPIIRHPDVRRMLMLQKAHVEGMRALVFYAAHVQDNVRLHPDDRYWARLNGMLLPIIKGYTPEKAYELLAQSMQVLGGSGYTQDYPIEQYIRDVKIESIYEGTTGIQALDLLFRQIARDRGETLTRLAAQITETVKGGDDGDQLLAERELLGTALEDVQGQLGVMTGHMMASVEEPPRVYNAALHANSLLESLAELLMGWLLLRHAEIAHAATPDAAEADRVFLEGKVSSAKWFAANVLPRAGLRRTVAEQEQGDLMDLVDTAF
jgi:alkylation response protein AidB-like acyl-CoA dehydrogenase